MEHQELQCISVGFWNFVDSRGKCLGLQFGVLRFWKGVNQSSLSNATVKLTAGFQKLVIHIVGDERYGQPAEVVLES
jgi:hypothetical protein